VSERFFKRLFQVGALWNLLGGAFIVLFTSWIFENAGLTPPSPALYYQSWIALFMTFGLGYYFVSRDLAGNRNIALLGMIGKLAFSAVFTYHFLVHPGEVPRFFLVPVAGDLVFAVLFAVFLASPASKKKNERAG